MPIKEKKQVQKPHVKNTILFVIEQDLRRV